MISSGPSRTGIAHPWPKTSAYLGLYKGGTSFLQVEVLDAKTREQLCFLDKVEPYSTIGDIKSLFYKSYVLKSAVVLSSVCVWSEIRGRGRQHPSAHHSSTLFYCDQSLLGPRPKSVCAALALSNSVCVIYSDPHWYPARQALKLDPKGKSLRDDEVLQNLPVGTTATMYFRDLGPQLGWTMVFLAEYVGPLFIYLLFYFRVPYVYLHRYAFMSSPDPAVTIACVCHTFHYGKRLIETIFVHRFSHGTMPLRTMLRNCAYYWGFSAWLAYYINHPLYTPPSYGELQVNSALVIFVMCELGNFSIHLTLNNLRGDGPRGRRYPSPTKNPFTWLFFFVSCPNYTYEVGVWVSFTIMTQCVPVALYTLLGFIQMSIWARGKHKAYSREFKDYPSLRMAIIPLIF